MYMCQLIQLITFNTIVEKLNKWAIAMLALAFDIRDGRVFESVDGENMLSWTFPLGGV